MQPNQQQSTDLNEVAAGNDLSNSTLAAEEQQAGTEQQQDVGIQEPAAGHSDD